MATIRKVLEKRARWNTALVFGTAWFLFALTLHGGARTPWIGWLMWFVMIATAALLVSWLLVDLRMRCPKCDGKLKNQAHKLVGCPHCGVNFDYPMPP